MTPEYIYGKLDQIEVVNISNSVSSLELNNSPARCFLPRYQNALNYLLVALLVIASFFTGFFVRPVASTSNLSNRQFAHENATRATGGTRIFLPPCRFDMSLPQGLN